MELAELPDVESRVSQDQVDCLALLLDDRLTYTRRCLERLNFLPGRGHRWLRTTQIAIPPANSVNSTGADDGGELHRWAVSLGSFARKRYPDIEVRDATGAQLPLLTREEHGAIIARISLENYFAELERRLPNLTPHAVPLPLELVRAAAVRITYLEEDPKEIDKLNDEYADAMGPYLLAMGMDRTAVAVEVSAIAEGFGRGNYAVTEYLCWVEARHGELVTLDVTYTAEDRLLRLKHSWEKRPSAKRTREQPNEVEAQTAGQRAQTAPAQTDAASAQPEEPQQQSSAAPQQSTPTTKSPAEGPECLPTDEMLESDGSPIADTHENPAEEPEPHPETPRHVEQPASPTNDPQPTADAPNNPGSIPLHRRPGSWLHPLSNKLEKWCSHQAAKLDAWMTREHPDLRRRLPESWLDFYREVGWAPLNVGIRPAAFYSAASYYMQVEPPADTKVVALMCDLDASHRDDDSVDSADQVLHRYNPRNDPGAVNALTDPAPSGQATPSANPVSTTSVPSAVDTVPAEARDDQPSAGFIRADEAMLAPNIPEAGVTDSAVNTTAASSATHAVPPAQPAETDAARASQPEERDSPLGREVVHAYLWPIRRDHKLVAAGAVMNIVFVYFVATGRFVTGFGSQAWLLATPSVLTGFIAREQRHYYAVATRRARAGLWGYLGIAVFFLAAVAFGKNIVHGGGWSVYARIVFVVFATASGFIAVVYARVGMGCPERIREEFEDVRKVQVGLWIGPEARETYDNVVRRYCNKTRKWALWAAGVVLVIAIALWVAGWFHGPQPAIAGNASASSGSRTKHRIGANFRTTTVTTTITVQAPVSGSSTIASTTGAAMP